MSEQVAAPINGHQEAPPPMPKHPNVAIMEARIGPMIREVFGDKAPGMTAKRALKDSNFRELLLLDLYVEVIKLRVEVGEIRFVLEQAAAPIENPNQGLLLPR